ncbi:MAG: protein translocase subunit SecD, partial [Ignavibacteriales bacterium]
MKEFRFRIIIILVAIGLSIYLLYPTYSDYQNSKEISEILDRKSEEIRQSNPDISTTNLNRRLSVIEDSIKASNPSIEETRQKRVKLGLDLQGGMRVVLEVNTGKLLEKLAKDPDENFRNLLKEAMDEAALSEESVVDIFAGKLSAKGIRLSR